MMELSEFFKKHPKAAMGFSGGVDSAYLLYEGLRQEAELTPFFVKAQFQPEFELEDAKRLCNELGADLRVIELDLEKADPRIMENGEKRCYYCKKAIFSAIVEKAEEQGFEILLDGSNASDDASDRPGMKAARELNVLSPLREAGLTKDVIRQKSKAAGLFTWDKPAYACLATRIPTGERISSSLLEKIERGEDALRKMGFSDFRLRISGGGGKIQVTKKELPLILEKREEILNELSFFESLVLDLSPR